MSGPLDWLFDATLTVAGQEVLWREIVGNLFGLASAVGFAMAASTGRGVFVGPGICRK